MASAPESYRSLEIRSVVNTMLYPTHTPRRSLGPAFGSGERAFSLLLFLTVTVFGQPAQSRSEQEMTAEIKRRVVETLQVHEGQTVADVGCGDGFYTIPLARALGPAGKVLAVDIDEAALSKLKQRLAEEGITSVEAIKGKTDDPLLPLNGLDAVLVANACHDMTTHEAMLRHIRSSLRPGGSLVVMESIWENREKQSRDEQTKHHQLAPAIAKQEIETSGFEIVSLRDPFWERTPDEDGKSRWWVIVARRPVAAR